jgi:hypothetical protein
MFLELLKITVGRWIFSHGDIWYVDIEIRDLTMRLGGDVTNFNTFGRLYRLRVFMTVKQR